MLFSSTTFLFIFFPCVLIVYFIIKTILGRKASNNVLFLFSIFFYAWGEPENIVLLIATIIFNCIFAICIEKYKERRKSFLVVSIVLNLAILFVFKYLNFVIDNIHKLGGVYLEEYIQIPDIVLPIGISFYTFQAMSYVIDVYYGRVRAKKQIVEVGLYIAFFPQLIAGPIVKYGDFAEQINVRQESWTKVCEGFHRFTIGLAKKVLLSNSFALVADECFGSNGNSACLYAWIGITAYTLQIYYDFSGYSDMAIGLAKVFGFELKENFNYPYFAKSISDFWRRWHISLGSFFREYVYIPLGGNRVSKNRLLVNTFIVWFLTGLWHGASWTFIVWGIMYGTLIVVEKLLFKKDIGGFIGHAYTLFFVMIGWVLFRSNTVIDAVNYLGIMFGISAECIYDVRSIVLIRENIAIFLIGLIGCVPWRKLLDMHVKNDNVIVTCIRGIVSPILFFVCCCYLVRSTYNPFIYFNF